MECMTASDEYEMTSQRKKSLEKSRISFIIFNLILASPSLLFYFVFFTEHVSKLVWLYDVHFLAKCILKTNPGLSFK
jgi:hypothetical protein